ncbi:MAG: beta-ribofuranosylaminobenzene 5'-phosphate synthase family protein [Alphaproteobacteria bacterium]
MANPERLNATRVTVRAPARLHLGFLDLNGGLGRRFGSIGLALDGLGTGLTVQSAPQMRVEGPDAERAQGHIATMQRTLALDGSYRATIETVVPPHAGLGSGTQMALAVAAALRRLHGLPLDPIGDALRLGRGQRSGIGIAAFHVGGLVVDGGRGAATQAPPLISRIAFPEDWRAIVLLDPARQGVHGASETAAFAQLTEFPAREAAHLCRLVLMQALPAAAESDLATFGVAIRELQAAIGDYFAPAQGARFTSPEVGAVLAHLDAQGAHGIGQSSWGPTGFAFAASPQEAERLAALARAHHSGRALDIRVCAALNRGAEITAE